MRIDNSGGVLVNAILGVLTIVLLGFAIVRVRSDLPLVAVVPIAPPNAPRPLRVEGVPLNAAASHLVARNPFRLSRSPSLLRVGQPLPDGDAADRGAARPKLVVRAIVGGPPWSALIEGLPQTTTATIVTEGETVGGLRVSAIGRDTVTVSAADTVWKLTLKQGER